MKRKILIVLGVILSLVLISGTTYIVVNNLLDKENKTETNSEENNNNAKTLTKDELNDYLKYVPKFFSAKDSYDLSTIDSTDLINNTLEFVSESDIKKGTCTDNCPDINSLLDEDGISNYKYIESSFVNNLLNKMYNLTLDSLKIDVNTVFTAYSETGNLCPIYFNGNFALNNCMLSGTTTREYKNYTATNEELIIYSYDGYITDGGKVCHINDRENCIPGPDLGESIDKEKDLSLCKHTYKKNGNGYYWYSTEVVKEENRNE